MEYNLDQFQLANTLEFKISFVSFGKVHLTSYGTGVDFVLNEIRSFKQGSVSIESLFKMFVDESRKVHYIMYQGGVKGNTVTNKATSFEIIIECLESL